MVSVIIPTFERDEKLKRALLSVIQQTYSDIEILVINDSNSDIVVKRIIKQINDVRIKYFKNERLKGANGARNTGILKAKGEYIAFLDDDDEFLENKLKTQIRCLKNKDESWGGVYSAYIIENNKRWKEFKKGNEGYLLKDILLNNLSLCAGNILIKAETIPIVGLWDENLYRQQDIEFLVRFSNIFKIAFDNNVSAKIYGHNLPDYFKTFEEREKFLNKIDFQMEIALNGIF